MSKWSGELPTKYWNGCPYKVESAPDGATITVAYKALRAEHPALQSLGNHDGAIGKILAPFAAVLDALNNLRNHASIAHPNENLLDAPEAALVVNAVRTMFHYLNQKLRPSC